MYSAVEVYFQFENLKLQPLLQLIRGFLPSKSKGGCSPEKNFKKFILRRRIKTVQKAIDLQGYSASRFIFQNAPVLRKSRLYRSIGCFIEATETFSIFQSSRLLQLDQNSHRRCRNDCQPQLSCQKFLNRSKPDRFVQWYDDFDAVVENRAQKFPRKRNQSTRFSPDRFTAPKLTNPDWFLTT